MSGKDHGHDKRNKTDKIMGDDLPGAEARFDEIIGLLAGVYHHGNYRDGEHGKHKCAQEFAKYIPIQFFHVTNSCESTAMGSGN